MKMKAAKKTKTSRGNLSVLLAGLLLVGSPALADSNSLNVTVESDRVSLAARNVSAQEVLDELARLFDIKVVQHAPLDRLVTIQFERQALSFAVREILDKESYQFFQSRGDAKAATDDTPGSRILWIFSEGTEVASLATVFYESILLRGDVREKKDAIKALRKIGTGEAVAALSMALTDEDEDIQIATIRALARVGGEDALAAIASIAQDDDPWIRSEAADALAQVGGASSSQYLDLAMQDEDPAVREAIVEAIVDDHGVNAIQALTNALSDPDPNVRMMAVDVLEEIGGHAAYAALALVSEDPDPAVRDAVRESLELLSQQ